MSSVERPDGSLAASMSGDFRLIARIVSASALVVPAAMLAAGGWVAAAGATSARGVSTGPPAVWLAAAAVGVQSGMAAADGIELLFLGQQRAYVTAVLICGGAALVLGLLRHQAQMLKTALRREDSDKRQADLEAGTFDPAVVRNPVPPRWHRGRLTLTRPGLHLVQCFALLWSRASPRSRHVVLYDRAQV